MAKKRKIIKRVYEQGREITFFHPQAKSPAAKRTNFTATEKTKPVPKHVPKPITEPPRKQEVVKSHTSIPTKVAETPVVRKALVENYAFPSGYGATRLTLLVKDPFWLHAYWEIAEDSIGRLRNTLSADDIANAQTILRMYDVTLIDFNGYNANSWFDIEVGRHTNNWYIKLWQDGVSYIGELGLRIRDGRFFALNRSNCIHTPRMGYSPRSDQMWMKVTDEKYAAPYAKHMPKRDLAVKKARKRPTQYEKELALASKFRKRTIHLTEEDIRKYYGKLSPLLRDVISTRLSKLYGRKTGGFTFILEGETKEEKLKTLSLLPKDYFIKRLVLGSSQDLVILGASERHIEASGGASEFLQEKIKAHKFFFELDAELIVYGRTEPDAEVWLGNKKIPLRSDGTFSLRFALPDGKLPLGFTAVSKDKKEQRKISTDIQRRTTYDEK